MTVVLNGLSDIRQHFFRNKEPITYVCDTSYYLMGIDEWVRGFRFVNMTDAFRGLHPRVLVPKNRPPYDSFLTLEAINTSLLENPETIDMIKKRGGGKVIFFLFDETCVEAAKKLGLEVILPPLSLRREVDSKIGATRIGDRAGVPSVPNVLAKVGSYKELRELSKHLGPDLVIQLPYGDSGATTYFISNEADYKIYASKIEAESIVKVMKRIRCRASAQEACVTRKGTIVGPLMTEIVGQPALTPYKGGWGGNEVCAAAFTPEQREAALSKTFRVGEELRRIGYRGYFEIDYLTDQDSGELYLGEINPRLTGCSGLTNLAAFAHADAPLFLFHLLEFSDVDFNVDIETLNRRWADVRNIDDWSQLIIKHIDDQPVTLIETPLSGIWRMEPEGARFVRSQTHRRTVEDDQDAFLLCHAQPGTNAHKGNDIAILVTRGRLMNSDYTLNDRALRWISEVRKQYKGVPLVETN